MIHHEAVLLSINAQHWQTKPGKYSHAGTENEYKVCYNPLAFGYCALQDTEILFNDRISTEAKSGLVKHLANIFHSMLTWQTAQRGRKIGIEADMTRGGIVTGEKNFTLDIEYYRRYTNDTGEQLESFIIQFKGSTDGQMPFEHMVTIDVAGTAYLGYCLVNQYAPVPRDMSDIFQLVY